MSGHRASDPCLGLSMLRSFFTGRSSKVSKVTFRSPGLALALQLSLQAAHSSTAPCFIVLMCERDKNEQTGGLCDKV